MQDQLKRPEILPMGGRLLELNPEIVALYGEVEAGSERLPVSIAERTDPAYENPEKIKEVLDYLSVADSKVQLARMGELGGIAHRLSYLASGEVLRRSWDSHVNTSNPVEDARRQYLYGPDQVDAEAWWRQGGSAMALVTIVNAFDLAASDDPEHHGYPTMSGPIDERILSHHFGDDVPELSGLSLHSAVAATVQNFGVVRGLPPLSAAECVKRADEKMQRLGDFVHASNSAEFLDVIRYCADGIGIRERMKLVNDAITEFAADEEVGHSPIIVSLGCGTALPMLELIKQLHEHGKTPRVILIDQDPIALAAAQQMAEQRGLSGSIELHCRKLFNKIGKPLDLKEILSGRVPAVIENSGLGEYVPDIPYRRLLREAYGALGAGGLLVNCSTNENRPHKNFLADAMGWPARVRRRSLSDMADMLDASKIPLDRTEARVTASGVYTGYFTRKL